MIQNELRLLGFIIRSAITLLVLICIMSGKGKRDAIESAFASLYYEPVQKGIDHHATLC